ncbi:MAG: threonine/serine dehydratase [Pseudomonadota bacterium]
MDINRIEAAAARLEGHARVTPLLEAPGLNALAGRRVLVKAESLQWTGSFKYRGARAALSAMDDATRSKGILAYSSGNHAQGIALAARQFGVPATIVMPADAPQAKVANVKALGGTVVPYDRETESREDIGAALAAKQGLTLVRPYDEPEVIAGQGTTGLEIASQAKAAGITEGDVFVCCGGGGLTSGIALALEAHAPGLSARPVEPEGFDDVIRSLEVGARQTNNRQSGSICDAIVTPSPGELTFPIMARLCGPGVVVTDHDALNAMAAAFRHLRIVLEPGGAVALAAALKAGPGDPVIALASGGNVDPDIFRQALETA